MKINLDQKITDIAGKPMQLQNNREATLGSVCATALDTMTTAINGKVRRKRGELAIKIYPGGIVNLSSEELQMVKTCCEEALMPVALAKVLQMLEAREK